MVGTAEAFRSKFGELRKAMLRLKGKELRYFDDVLKYDISHTRDSAIQQERNAVC
jgi:hypothetical protein